MSLQDQLKARLGSTEVDTTNQNTEEDKELLTEEVDNAKAITIATAASEAANYSPVKGDYKSIRLSGVVLPNGVRVVPNLYGYYENVEGNKELKELLEYYAKQGLASKVE